MTKIDLNVQQMLAAVLCVKIAGTSSFIYSMYVSQRLKKSQNCLLLAMSLDQEIFNLYSTSMRM